jgi:hypothetical protein
MSELRIVTIGASAGGVGPLRTIAEHLPIDFPAAICVVLHTPAGHQSRLPEILNHARKLPAAMRPTASASSLAGSTSRRRTINVDVDFVLPVEAIVRQLDQLVPLPAPAQTGDLPSVRLEFEVGAELLSKEVLETDSRPGKLSAFTCPECHGPLWELQEGDLIRYRFGNATLRAATMTNTMQSKMAAMAAQLTART